MEIGVLPAFGPKPNRPIQKRDSLYATCSHRMRSSLCRKFLNFAFTRIWRGDRIGAQGGRVPGLNIKWYGVRRKLTRFLQAVHTREYAPQFPSMYALIHGLSVQEGHWLANEHIDIDSFVKAAM